MGTAPSKSAPPAGGDLRAATWMRYKKKYFTLHLKIKDEILKESAKSPLWDLGVHLHITLQRLKIIFKSV
jgi:hypothetical protein